MKSTLSCIVSCLLMISFASTNADAQEVQKSPSIVLPSFNPKANAANDINSAVVEAKKSGRRILLDVGGEWCIWCHRLDTLFMKNPDVYEFMVKNFVVVKVNYSKENENKEVLSRYPKIPGYPHFFVLDENGSLLQSQDTGVLEAGKRHDPEKVLAFLKRWAPPSR